jgi:hypothetical protein
MVTPSFRSVYLGSTKILGRPWLVLDGVGIHVYEKFIDKKLRTHVTIFLRTLPILISNL